MITIYHNTRCGKSRKACAFAEENKANYKIYEYLKEGISKSQIQEILDKGNYTLEDILRNGETVFKENYKGKNLSNTQLMDAMVENPILLQRPIAVGENFAMILRDDESLAAFLEKV